MKLKKKSIFIYIVLLIIVLVIVLGFFMKNGEVSTYEIQKGDFVQVTETSGKVVPAKELDFSFEVSGRVESIYVKVGDVVSAGDVLIRLDSSEVDGEVNEARAILRSERVKLEEISGQSVDSQNRLESLKNALIDTLKKAYVTADDVIRNTVDTFMTDANTSTPDFDLSLGDYFLRQNIEDQRVIVGKMLNDWNIKISTLNTSNIVFADAQEAGNNLRKIESLLALISSGVDEFSPTNNTTQGQIDAYISGISSGRKAIASVIVDINSSTENLRDAQADVPITQASIANANATIDRLTAKSEKYSIRAPFDGVITFSNVEVGQAVVAGENVLSMVSDKPLEVEAFIPEVNIAGVNVGDIATLTFDAFGEAETFDGFVSHIDPRETIKGGVTTYKIGVEFSQFYEQIFSGMTNEIVIQKLKLDNQITIPTRLIDREGEKNYVQVLNGTQKERVEIEVGMSDGRGNTIVKSGLSVGDKVIEK